MTRLSRIQQEVRQQIRHMASSTLLPEQLGVRLLQALQRAVPSDSQTLLGVDSSSLLFNRLLANQGPYEMRWLWWLEHIYLAHEPNFGTTFPGIMRAQASAIVLHDRFETSWGTTPETFSPLHESEYYQIYHEIETPAGGVLRACFTMEGKAIAALEMVRMDARHNFQPGDLMFLRLIAPLIGQALHAALDRERANAHQHRTDPDATGVLILSPNNSITVATPAAEAWISLLWHTERRQPASSHIICRSKPTSTDTGVTSPYGPGSDPYRSSSRRGGYSRRRRLSCHYPNATASTNATRDTHLLAAYPSGAASLQTATTRTKHPVDCSYSGRKCKHHRIALQAYL